MGRSPAVPPAGRPSLIAQWALMGVLFLGALSGRALAQEAETPPSESSDITDSSPNEPPGEPTDSEPAPSAETESTDAPNGEVADTVATPVTPSPTDATALENQAQDELASTQEVSEQPAAKFAIVLTGDVDASMRAVGERWRQRLLAASFRPVSDEAVRGALLGQPGEPGDGLGPLRAARRTVTLDVDPEGSLGAFRLMGRASSADAIVVLRANTPVRVFHVAGGAFFVRPAGATDAFVLQAVRESALALPSGVSPAEVAHADPDAAPSTDDEEIPPARAFMRRNWPYFVAGLLLAGAIAWVVVGATRDDEVPPPVLRFRPGNP